MPLSFPTTVFPFPAGSRRRALHVEHRGGYTFTSTAGLCATGSSSMPCLKATPSGLVKGQFPVAVIFIAVPPDAVDVNVHPTKNEVRFARQRDVHEAVRRAVAQTLYEKDRPGWGNARSSGNAGRVSEAATKDFGFSHPGLRNAQRATRGDQFSIQTRNSHSTIEGPATRNSQRADRHLAKQTIQRHARHRSVPQHLYCV